MTVTRCIRWAAVLAAALSPLTAFPVTADEAAPLLTIGFNEPGFTGLSAGGTVAALKTVNCSLVAGHSGQAAQIGDAETVGQLMYPAADNIRAERGTLEFWVRLHWDFNDNTSRLTRVWFDVGTGGNQDRIYLHSKSGGLVFGIFDHAATLHHVRGRGVNAWQSGEWHHVACTWDLAKKQMAIWLDGELDSATPTNVHARDWKVSAEALRILRLGSFGQPETPFNGAIDELKIFGSVRYATQEREPTLAERTEMRNRQQLAATALGDLQKNIRKAEATGITTSAVWPTAVAAETGLWRMSLSQRNYALSDMQGYCAYMIQECEKANRLVTTWLAGQARPQPAPPALQYPVKVDGDGFRDASGQEVLLVGIRNIEPYEFEELSRFFNLLAWNSGAPAKWIDRTKAANYAGQVHFFWNADRTLREAIQHDPLLRNREGRTGHNWGNELCVDTAPARHLIAEALAHMAIMRRGDDAAMAYGILSAEDAYMCYCSTSQAMFREWLQARYGSINQLNDRWDAAYDAFSAITCSPMNRAQARTVKRAAWSDWLRFNLDRTTDFYAFLKSEMRRGLPTLPLCGGTHLPLASPQRMVHGIDVEALNTRVNDVLQCETVYMPPTRAADPELPAYGLDIFGQCSVDFQRSTSAKPATDLEYHAWLRYLPILQETGTYLPRGYTATAIYRHFLHGVRAANIWVWNRKPASAEDRTAFGTSPQIPLESVEECLRASMNVRRRSAEIHALSRIPAEIAILLSDSTFLNIHPQLIAQKKTAAPCTVALENAYHAALFLDAPIAYVTERSIAAGSLEKYRMVLVPGVSHLPRTTVDALMAFVERGGRLIIMPQSLLFDEYHRPQPYLRDLVTIEATRIEGLAQNPSANELADPEFLELNVVDPGDARIPSVWMHTTGTGLFTDRPVALAGTGVRQTIRAERGETLAVFDDDGQPALVRLDRGRGQIYYAAIPLRPTSCAALLDVIMMDAGVSRPIRVAGTDGRNAWGVEARSCPEGDDLLLSAMNLLSEPVEVQLVAPEHTLVGLHNLLTDAPMETKFRLDALETVLLRIKTVPKGATSGS